jgi:hypothetical protein
MYSLLFITTAALPVSASRISMSLFSHRAHNSSRIAKHLAATGSYVCVVVVVAEISDLSAKTLPYETCRTRNWRSPLSTGQNGLRRQAVSCIRRAQVGLLQTLTQSTEYMKLSCASQGNTFIMLAGNFKFPKPPLQKILQSSKDACIQNADSASTRTRQSAM